MLYISAVYRHKTSFISLSYVHVSSDVACVSDAQLTVYCWKATILELNVSQHLVCTDLVIRSNKKVFLSQFPWEDENVMRYAIFILFFFLIFYDVVLPLIFTIKL